MSSYSNIAIIGATGNIGQHVTNALLSDKTLKTTILTRPESLQAKKELLDKFTAAGGKVVGVDFKDPAALSKALSGIEVVISAAAGTALMEQIPMINAAKAAGVKRFYPSEFAFDDTAVNIGHPMTDAKLAIRKAVVDAGLETVLTFTGSFQEYMFSPIFSVDFATSTIEIVGDGNVKFGGWTTVEIGKVVAESINHKSLASVPGQKTYYLRANGFTNTWNEIVDAYEKVSGKKWTRKYLSIADAEERVKQNPMDFGTIVRIWIAKGYGKLEINNASQFSVKPTSFEELFKAQLAK